MNLSDAIKLIEDHKYNHLKVIDPDGKKVFDLNAESPDGLIAQLQSYENILRSYGRLKFLVANDSIYKQNWKDAFSWNIVFSGTSASPSPAPMSTIGAVPPGYISASEAALMAQVKELQLQSVYDKRFADLEKKIEERDNTGFEKYMPMAGLFLDLDQKKIENMMALAGLQSAINGKGALAGPPSASLQTTVEEKELVENIQNEMAKLSKQVEIAKIYEFLKVLNNNPKFLDTLTQMAQQFKT